MQRIIYKSEDGGVSIIIPSPEALQTLTITEIAKKDVPNGVPYQILDADNIPSDRTFRQAWEADIQEPDGEGIGADAWFAEQAAIKAAQEAEQAAQEAEQAAIRAAEEAEQAELKAAQEALQVEQQETNEVTE